MRSEQDQILSMVTQQTFSRTKIIKSLLIWPRLALVTSLFHLQAFNLAKQIRKAVGSPRSARVDSQHGNFPDFAIMHIIKSLLSWFHLKTGYFAVSFASFWHRKIDQTISGLSKMRFKPDQFSNMVTYKKLSMIYIINNLLSWLRLALVTLQFHLRACNIEKQIRQSVGSPRQVYSKTRFSTC